MTDDGQARSPMIHFGVMVEYYPISARDQSRLHQFGKKVPPGISLGYALILGGMWKGDIFVADIEELEKIVASKIYPQRINAKEVLTPQKWRQFYFPNCRRHSKIVGK